MADHGALHSHRYSSEGNETGVRPSAKRYVLQTPEPSTRMTAVSLTSGTPLHLAGRSTRAREPTPLALVSPGAPVQTARWMLVATYSWELFACLWKIQILS